METDYVILAIFHLTLLCRVTERNPHHDQSHKRRMKCPIIALFNAQGGVYKTTLVHHLAWMYNDLGVRIVAADLDPQANLSSAFLPEERLEELWQTNTHADTIFAAVQPLMEGTGDVGVPHLEILDDRIALLVGDLSLSTFEDELSNSWLDCLGRKPRAFRVMSAFWRVMQKAATAHQADVILVDLGPNLGAINRAALIAADYIVVPLSPDIFSLQGLRNLGPTLRDWRGAWQERLAKRPTDVDLPLPTGQMEPAGYIVSQHSVRLDRPVKAYDRWIARIPSTYQDYVLGQPTVTSPSIAEDPHKLALLKSYRSLMPLAQEASKPMFHLKPADGAIGSHLRVALSAGRDFKLLAQVIAERTNVTVPVPSYA